MTLTTNAVACLGIAGIAALVDLATRRIPNLITLGGLALGITLHGCVGLVDGPAAALHGIGAALFGAVACAFLPAVGFWRREVGGGDVKLFAAIGALLGPSLGFDAQTFTFVIILFVLWPWRLMRAGVLKLWLSAVVRRETTKADFPVARVVLGPAIFCGVLCAVLRHGTLP